MNSGGRRRRTGGGPCCTVNMMPEREPKVILVVEDNEYLRAFLSNVLISVGFEVLEAADEPEALIAAGSARHGVDLLITPVRNRTINGFELAGHLTECHPSLKVLYVTDERTREAVAERADGKRAASVAHPVQITALLGQVRRLFATPGAAESKTALAENATPVRQHRRSSARAAGPLRKTAG